MVSQTLTELAGYAGSNRYTTTLHRFVKSKTVGSFFQREIRFPSPWDLLDLTRNQAGDSISFASIQAMPTTTSLLPICWALLGVQWLGLHDLVPSYHPRSQARALGTTDSPELCISGLQGSSSACQWPSTLAHRPGG